MSRVGPLLLPLLLLHSGTAKAAPPLASAAVGEDGAAPAQDGAAPAQDGAAPAQDGAAPAQDGAAPAQDGAAPAQDGAAPAPGGAAGNEVPGIQGGPLRLLVVEPNAAAASLEGAARAVEAGIGDALAAPSARELYLRLEPRPGERSIEDSCGEGTRGLRCWGSEARKLGADFVLLPALVRQRGESRLELRLLHAPTATVCRELFAPLPSGEVWRGERPTDAPDAAPDPTLAGKPLPAAAAEPTEAQVRRATAAALAALLEPEPGLAAHARPVVAGGRSERAIRLAGMVPIPGGSFPMGSAPGGGEADEQPRHTVTLAAYWIDRTEVTVGAYATCVARGQCDAPGAPLADRDAARCTGARPELHDHPLTCIGWEAARAYCRALGKTLPSEARWERAARGETGRRFPWGEGWPPPPGGPNLADRSAEEVLQGWPHIAGYDDGQPLTGPAGGQPADATPEGVLGLGGNVAEWTLDCYDPQGYANLPASDPLRKGGGSCALRVVRGGSWFQEHPDYLRAANRQPAPPGTGSPQVGFRCVAPDRSGAAAVADGDDDED